MEKAENDKRSKSDKSKVGRKIIIGILAAILGCILLIGIANLIQVQKLRKAASSIQIGDSQTEVENLLGQPMSKYYSGFPSGGGAATKHGSYYGGSFNFALEFIDGIFYMVLKNHPQWYSDFEIKNHWPVVIEYDMNDVVIKVIK